MDLYVLNCQKQHQILQFRVPEKREPVRVVIRSGQQHAFRGLASDVVGAIIAQLPGAVRAVEVSRTKDFIGLAYDIDRPVPLTQIMVADEHNSQVLDARGQEFRNLAGVGNYSLVNKALRGIVGKSTLEVVEDVGRTNSRDGLAQKITVEREGPAPRGRRRRAA
jgi:hypothetical protein